MTGDSGSVIASVKYPSAVEGLKYFLVIIKILIEFQYFFKLQMNLRYIIYFYSQIFHPNDQHNHPKDDLDERIPW
jgi:hypothetical protein